jgi:hypothetical protein
MGTACPLSGGVSVQCVPGTFQPTGGALACQTCDSGTYDAATLGRTSSCALCPADKYCLSPTQQAQCPVNTRSTSGASSQLGCRCAAGFSCSYTKRISATVRLNATAANFNADVGGIRTAFINAVAAAAGVPASQITIGSVLDRTGARRLLSFVDDAVAVDEMAFLMVDASSTAAETTSTAKSDEQMTTDVHVLVEGSQSLRAIPLSVSTTWHPLHAVRARRMMPSE